MNTNNRNLIALSPVQRVIVQPLFADFPYLRGEVASIVYGGMGQIFVTSLTDPKAALAVLDFRYIAGEPGSEAAVELVRALEKGNIVIASPAAWQAPLLDHYPGVLKTYTREAFQVGDFDIERLRHFSQNLPEGFRLKRVDPHEVAQFAADLHPALIYNWSSPAEFAERGFGFGVLHQGRFVSGVSSAAIGARKVEFEVQTHRDYNRRGLATAVCAAMILYCLENDFEPCWDAANSLSARLARKLGFISTGQYNAYILA